MCCTLCACATKSPEPKSGPSPTADALPIGLSFAQKDSVSYYSTIREVLEERDAEGASQHIRYLGYWCIARRPASHTISTCSHVISLGSVSYSCKTFFRFSHRIIGKATDRFNQIELSHLWPRDRGGASHDRCVGSPTPVERTKFKPASRSCLNICLKRLCCS